MTRFILLLTGLVLLIGASPALADARGVKVDGKAPAEFLAEQAGKSWAVVIGINEYRDPRIKRLKYAVADAQAVSQELTRRGYQVTLLLNQQATRRAIESELRTKLRQRVGKEDRVVVYYAGHGQDDKVEGSKTMGYLLPVDGELEDIPATGISMGVIKELADALPAKQALFLMDACYGGVAGQQTRSLPKMTEAYLKQITREKGRQLITAGGAEQEALEASDGGHGLFTYYLLKGLSEGLADLNDDGIIPASELYTYLDSRVFSEAQMKGHQQRPELWALAAEKGEFVFLTSARPATGGAPTASAGSGSGAASDEVAKMRAELDALKSQMTKPAEQPKPIEEARARPYEAPRQLEREITGKDGAPMLLVPEGEFLYRENNQRLSLSSFYIDKYEVSTKLYANFLQATGRTQPIDWSKQVALVGSGDRPVVIVTLDDVNAYCRHYGKRLPTEQEWEKAARGTDGRKYPWGDEEPTSRHALFDMKTKWNGYGTLATVESYEAGRSPYGLYNMAGNVWEWTSSDYDSNSKVVRGGSWFDGADKIHVSARAWGRPLFRDQVLGFRCAMDAPSAAGMNELTVASLPSYDQPRQMGKEITGKDGAPMVLIPTGEFEMGINSPTIPFYGPKHLVYLDAFYIDKYEVTNRLYAKFLQNSSRGLPLKWQDVKIESQGDYPVGGVNWHDADEYCRWAGKRLPSEAEWEKAGWGNDGRRYPWGSEKPTIHSSFPAMPKGHLFPVHSKPAGESPFGVHGMAGNVAEWVADWHSTDYFKVSPKNNPPGPQSGEEKIIRDGGWGPAENQGLEKSYVRVGAPPSHRDPNLGFRCAMDAPK